MKKLLTNRGFTLIELLVVIAVVGVLAAGSFALINPIEQIKKTNDAKRKSDLNQIQKALDAYYNDYGRYPAARVVFLPIKMYHIYADGESKLWGSTGWQYINPLPQDPVFPSRTYAYISPADGQSYYLYASLESGASDPQACNGGNTCSNASFTINLCGPGSVKCNYGVTSPNVSP